MQKTFGSITFCFLQLMAGQNLLLAQLSGQKSAMSFPSDPSAWVNSRPITGSALQGKSAILWFFEEDCPRCKEKWPGILETAKKFEGKPVVFIAVNSGTARPELEAYLREVNCAWPTICDTSREFEKASGVGEISLMNIHQMRVLSAKGDMRPGDWMNMEETVERALSGAKWTVDPAEVPASLRTTWACIEFGQCAAAAAPLKKALVSGKPDVKEAAGKLNAAVQQKIAVLVDEAKQAESSDSKWAAFKLYQVLTADYAGYDLPPAATQAKKALADDDLVKKQLSAAKTLDTIQKSVRPGNTASQRSAITRLKKLIQDFPGTDAADQAQELLSQFK